MTVVIIKNKPHISHFHITPSESEYLGVDKVPEEIVKQFKTAISSPTIVYNITFIRNLNLKLIKRSRKLCFIMQSFFAESSFT